MRGGLVTTPEFALIGEDAAENCFEIGNGTNHTFGCSGVFHLFANDLPSMRWNNYGKVTLTATPITASPANAPLPPPPPVPQCGVLAAWREFAGVVNKTQGFFFIAALVLLTGLLLAFSEQGR